MAGAHCWWETFTLQGTQEEKERLEFHNPFQGYASVTPVPCVLPSPLGPQALCLTEDLAFKS